MRHNNRSSTRDRLRRLAVGATILAILSGLGAPSATAAPQLQSAASTVVDRVKQQANPQTDWPWVIRIHAVKIRSGGFVYSAGTGVLINERTVLTAAHVVEGMLDATIHAGRDYYGTVDQIRAPVRVDRIDNLGANGDLVALYLTEPIILTSYAPVNPGYLPFPHNFPGQAAQPVAQESIRGAGMGQRPGAPSFYVTAVIDRFHQYNARTFAQQQDALYPSGRIVLANIDHTTGVVNTGDSGGLVMIDGRGVGLAVGGEEDSIWSPPTYLSFVPFGDSPEFMNRAMAPPIGSVNTGPSGSHPALEEPDEVTAAWYSCTCGLCHGARQRSVPEPGESEEPREDGAAESEAGSCSATGFRVFYQPVKDASGGAWAGAHQVDVADPSARETKLTLPAGTGEQLWRTTVVPLIDGQPVHVDAQTGLPFASHSGDLVGSTTGQYSMPTGLRVVPTGTEGMVRASWDATVTAPGAPKLAGYHVFVRSTSVTAVGLEWGSWMSPSNGGITDQTTTTFNVSEAGTTGPWQTVVLPYYEQADQTVLVGADETGKPIDTDAAERGVLVNTPKPRGQVPQPGTDSEVVYVTAGTVGESSITALFDGVAPRVAPDAKQEAYGTVEWEWSESKDGIYSAEGEWSALSGQNTTTLRFGTDGHPADQRDTGWFRLKATNSLGTAYSIPVEVKIGDWVAPRVLGQSPDPFGLTVGSTTTSGDAQISVRFTTNPGAGAQATEPEVEWKKRDLANDGWEPADLSRLATLVTSDGPPDQHQRIATLVFGRDTEGGPGPPSEADTGTYIAQITTTYADGSAHVTNSLPVQVTIGPPHN